MLAYSECDAPLVNKLRKRTGIGIMECKKALTEANGDIERAISYLRQKACIQAAKKASRIAKEGTIVAGSIAGRLAAMLEINYETDFVARYSKNFANQVLYLALKLKNSVASMMEGELGDVRNQLVLKLGENISVKRVVVLEAPAGCKVGTYVHGYRIGAIVVFKGGSEMAARDIAMHVAAINPLFAKPEDIPQLSLYREQAIILAKQEIVDKHSSIVENILQGSLKKYIEENSLVNQPFVKNQKLRVVEYAKEILTFVRYEVR